MFGGQAVKAWRPKPLEPSGGRLPQRHGQPGEDEKSARALCEATEGPRGSGVQGFLGFRVRGWDSRRLGGGGIV